MTRTAARIAAAVTVVALAFAVVRCGTGDPLPADRGHPARNDTASVPPAEKDELAFDRVAPVDDVAAATAIDPALDHAFGFEVEVLLLDPIGLPRTGEVIALAPPGVEGNHTTAASDAEGLVVVAFRSRTPTGHVIATDDHGVLHRLPVRDGQRTRWCMRRTTSDVLFEDPPTMLPGLHPFAVFETNLARVPGDGQLVHVGALGPGHFGIAPALRPRIVRAVEGTVFGDDGRPAARTAVALMASPSRPLERTATDELGRFTLDDVPQGTFVLRAGGDSRGLGTTTVVVADGTTEARIDLRREPYVRGRIERNGGQPTKYRLTWRARDGSWCSEATPDADRAFVFANVPALPGTVHVWADDLPLPVAVAENVLPGLGELVLRHDPRVLRRLSVEPLLPEECRGAPVAVRVWQVDTGLGAIATQRGDEHTVDGLVPGPYQVEVSAAGSGVIDLGRHWLDGNADCELGRVVLPRPGRVRISVAADTLPADEGRRAFEICRVRSDLDVRIVLREFPLDRDVLLPAGEYAFAFRHRDGSVRFRQFAVRTGEETVVTAPK